MASRTQRPATPRASAVFILAITVLGALACLPFFGKIGLLIGGLGGICVAMVVDAAVRARANEHLQEGRPLDLVGLEPQQQLAVLAQGFASGGGDFRSELVRGIDSARKKAQSDFEAGWRAAQSLTLDYPRSPAPWALLAELARGDGRLAAAREAEQNALELAAVAGTNQIAVEIYDAIDESARRELSLTRRAWTQLSRALQARDRGELASEALRRAEAVDDDDERERLRAITQLMLRDAPAASSSTAPEARAEERTDD